MLRQKVVIFRVKELLHFASVVTFCGVTLPQRAILTNVAVGFIRAISFADIMCLVSDVSGVHSTTKSD